jgi:hypothetical protein
MLVSGTPFRLLIAGKASANASSIVCRGGGTNLVQGRASCLSLFGVCLPGKLAEVRKVYLPSAVAPGPFERRHQPCV